VPGDLRARTRERFGARCAYCGVHEDTVGATLTVDHHRPRSKGGTDEEENLVYSCPRCNEHKGAYWHEQDPPHVRLLNPGHDTLDAHVREDDDGRLAGLTREGTFFIERLRLNRQQLVAYRLAFRSESLLVEQLEASRRRIADLERTISDLRAALDSAADEIERRSVRRRS
jgi:hypothetical protein